MIDPIPGSRPDWEIIVDLAARMGQQWKYDSVSDVFDELDEVEAEEMMLGVLDAPEHVGAALLARMAPDRGGFIHDVEFLGVADDLDLVARNHRHLGEQGAFGFPAAAAGCFF